MILIMFLSLLIEEILLSYLSPLNVGLHVTSYGLQSAENGELGIGLINIYPHLKYKR